MKHKKEPWADTNIEFCVSENYWGGFDQNLKECKDHSLNLLYQTCFFLFSISIFYVGVKIMKMGNNHDKKHLVICGSEIGISLWQNFS